VTGEGRRFGAAFFLLASQAFASPTQEQLAACEACHGKHGNSTIAGTPSIAAQPVTFLENQLVFFREGLRNAPVMEQVAKGMKDEDITALARHFSAQKPDPGTLEPPDRSLIVRGRELAESRHCGQCHLPGYEGRAQIPRLAGQREDYLASSMFGYRDAKRTGADTTMQEVLGGMSDADIKALAHFLARR
jgi:cytochrome c553